MKPKLERVVWACGCALGVLLLGAGSAGAQSEQSQQQQQQQPQSQDKKDQAPASNTTGLTLDTTPPPVNAEEDGAFKAFEAVPNTDLKKKVSVGEEFLQKYPQSRYRPPVYSILLVAYLQTGQTQKAFEIGDKEIELKPDDVQTLAILCQTIPRTVNASTPDGQKQLDKAESYGKRTVEIVPTMPKPENLTDEKFVTAKNQALAMAHSGLGLVHLQHGKYSDAITELEASIKADPNPTADPVTYYLLGVADEKASHFDSAVAAFTKCGSIAGPLQDRCKGGAAEAKKASTTQLSAPN